MDDDDLANNSCTELSALIKDIKRKPVISESDRAVITKLREASERKSATYTWNWYMDDSNVCFPGPLKRRMTKDQII